MNYILFEDYITLQALLKDLRIISSGGAIKGFLQTTEVFVNGELEQRRGKKLRIADQVTIPELEVSITLTAPNQEELAEHQAEQTEKERVATLAKKMNQDLKAKKATKPNKKKTKLRFPGV